jgi:hypothetical protein
MLFAFERIVFIFSCLSVNPFSGLTSALVLPLAAVRHDRLIGPAPACTLVCLPAAWCSNDLTVGIDIGSAPWSPFWSNSSNVFHYVPFSGCCIAVAGVRIYHD